MKNGQKHHKTFIIVGVFSIKVTKNAKKTRGDMFYTFLCMTSHMLNAKLCNFITSWNLPKSSLVLHTISKNLTEIQRWSFGLNSPLTQGNFLKITLWNEKENNLEKKMYGNISLCSQYFSPGAGSNVHKTYFYFLKIRKKCFILSS